MATPTPIVIRLQTPVPVTLRGEVPVTAHTALPVVEQHPPKPDPNSERALWIAVAGVVVSLVAAWAAVKAAKYAGDTLAKVIEQIELGNKELAAVTEDLEITKKLLKPKPKLVLRFEGGDVKTTLNGGVEKITLWVLNEGDKTARDVLLRLVVPASLNWRQFSSTDWPSRTTTHDKTRYVQYDVIISKPSYPKFEIAIDLLCEGFKPDSKTHAILWRLACDDGTFPHEEEWGAVIVHATPLPNASALE